MSVFWASVSLRCFCTCSSVKAWRLDLVGDLVEPVHLLGLEEFLDGLVGLCVDFLAELALLLGALFAFQALQAFPGGRASSRGLFGHVLGLLDLGGVELQLLLNAGVAQQKCRPPPPKPRPPPRPCCAIAGAARKATTPRATIVLLIVLIASNSRCKQEASTAPPDVWVTIDRVRDPEGRWTDGRSPPQLSLSDTRGRNARTFSGNTPKNACLAMPAS